jgi:hypothetical protein
MGDTAVVVVSLVDKKRTDNLEVQRELLRALGVRNNDDHILRPKNGNLSAFCKILKFR